MPYQNHNPYPHNINLHNSTDNSDNHTYRFSLFTLGFVIFGCLAIYSYISTCHKINNDDGQDGDEGFPDIDNFIPDLIDRERQSPPDEQVPPSYENSNLHLENPPSYNSIVDNVD